MTAIIKDIEPVWLHPTADGMAFSTGGDEEVAEVYLRVIIEASDREEWGIDEIQMITFSTEFYKSETETQTRSREFVHVLEGEFSSQAMSYLYRIHGDTLQDAVNLEILEDGETVGGYEPLRASDVVDCGRGV